MLHLDRHIALVGPVSPPAGGMAQQTAMLSELLRARGWEVTLIPVNLPYSPVWIGRVRGVRALFRLYHYFILLFKQIGRVELVHVMANSGLSWHLFAAPAIWVAWFRGKPIVLNYRGGNAPRFFKRSWRWVRPSLRRVSCVWVPTGFLQRVFADYGVTVDIVPNLLDLTMFQRTRVFETAASVEAPHLIVTRNLEAIYGVDTVLRAFSLIVKQYPRARLSIAGSGPERDALEAMGRELGISQQVVFRGRLSRSEIVNLYADADLMLNASHLDNTPNAILEALASGVPVVSSDVGGIPFLVCHEKSALLVAPYDDQALAEAALRIMRDRQLRAKLVGGGYTVVQRYECRAVVKQMEAGYLQLLKNSRQVMEKGF